MIMLCPSESRSLSEGRIFFNGEFSSCEKPTGEQTPLYRSSKEKTVFAENDKKNKIMIFSKKVLTYP